MLKALLLILIIFYSVRFISRLLLPLLFRTVVKKASRNMRPSEHKSREGKYLLTRLQSKKNSLILQLVNM